MRMKNVAVLVAVIGLTTLSFTRLHAQSASHEFPNLDGGFNVVPPAVDASLSLDSRLGPVVVFKGGSRIRGWYDVPDSIAQGPAQTGQTVAAGVANALCAGAAPVWACEPCVAGAAAIDIDCTLAADPQVGITIHKDADGAGDIGARVTVDKTAGMQNPNIRSFFLYSQTVGNAHEVDLYERVLLQVVPNGVNGSVGFRVFYPAGGDVPLTFSVNTGSFGTSDALHTAIAAGLTGLNLGLAVEVHTTREGDSTSLAAGSFVVIANAGQTLTKVGVNGLPGQITATETTLVEVIPTMSEWAMIALIGLLLASGAWMLRRFPLGS